MLYSLYLVNTIISFRFIFFMFPRFLLAPLRAGPLASRRAAAATSALPGGPPRWAGAQYGRNTEIRNTQITTKLHPNHNKHTKSDGVVARGRSGGERTNPTSLPAVCGLPNCSPQRASSSSSSDRPPEACLYRSLRGPLIPWCPGAGVGTALSTNRVVLHMGI